MRKLLVMVFAALLLILSFGYASADEGQDLLLVMVYNDQGEDTTLSLYDPAADVSTPLLANHSAYGSTMLSADGRLAYSAHIEGRLELDVWDTRHPDQEFVAVMPVGAGDQYALAWSPDGHRLAYQSRMNDGHALLYVWDGQTSVDITPPDAVNNVDQYLDTAWSPDGRYLLFASYPGSAYGQIYVWDGKTVMNISPDADVSRSLYYDDFAWSADGRLAFTLSDNVDSLTEIYVWDGHTTMNLSQNPGRNDDTPVWSADSRLAFRSQGDAYRLLLWDGQSMKDGQPDASTFVQVAPDIWSDVFSPAWTSSGQIAFVAQTYADTSVQVYVWDGETATNISRNPTQGNDSPVWSADGRWAFMGYSSSSQPFLYVRDAEGLSQLMTHGMGKPAWSSDGVLTFCNAENGEWVLHVWNGEDIREIARGLQIWARWQSGSGVVCSSG